MQKCSSDDYAISSKQGLDKSAEKFLMIMDDLADKMAIADWVCVGTWLLCLAFVYGLKFKHKKPMFVHVFWVTISVSNLLIVWI